MSKMVDSVARAMQRHAASSAQWESIHPASQASWRSFARVAIAAMREPDERELERAFDLVPTSDFEDDAFGYVREVYQAVIDAVLQPSE